MNRKAVMETVEQPTIRRVRTRWIRQPAWDVAMALSWIPFAALAVYWDGDSDRIQWLVGATLIFSVSHQPLTVPLVYADPHVRRSRPVIFTYTPVVFLVAVIIGLQLDPIVVAVVAGVWNAAHTLQQRYGVSRIYGRKVGQGSGTIEHWLLWSALVLVLIWAAAEPATPDRISSAGLGGRNQRGLSLITDAAPVARWLLPAMLALVLALIVAWVREERAAEQVNPAKWFYLASTAALFATTVVSPMAGFVGYIGSHAAEYYLIVHNHLGDRYPDEVTDGGAPLGRAVRSRPGPLGLMAMYTAFVAALIWAVRTFGSFEVYGLVFLTLGALHLFYDGLIWKLRRPEVARGFRIEAHD